MALNCKLSAPITNADSCEWSTPGLRTVAVGAYPEQGALTLTPDTDCEGMIATVAFPDGASDKLYKIDFSEEGSTFQTDLTNSNGTKYLVDTLTLDIPFVSCNLLTQIKALCLGKLIFQVTLQNGQTVLLGADNGMKCDSFSIQSGSGDTGSHVTATFSGKKTGEPAYLVEALPITVE